MLMFDQLVRQYIVDLRAYHLHMQDAHLAQGIAVEQTDTDLLEHVVHKAIHGAPGVARAMLCGQKKAPLDETTAAKINELVVEAVPDGEEERLWAAKERAWKIAKGVRPLERKHIESYFF